MIAQFDWQVRFNKKEQTAERPSRLSFRMVGAALGGLTAVFLFWLLFHYQLSPDGFALLPPILRETLRLLEAAGMVTMLALWGVWLWQWKRPFAPKHAIRLTREDMFALTPAEFEQYTARLFRQKGYKVQLRGRSGDKGVDLMVERAGGKRAIVQCKRYRHPVGPDVIRELYGTLIHERVAHAFLVTTADISNSARQWAAGKPMTLIDGDLLLQISERLLHE
jgi:restriction system protein